MTKYQSDIDDAQEMIADAGIDFVIRRVPDTSTENTYSESDYGSLSIADSTLTFASGDLTSVVSVGDQVSLREITDFENRGPFAVTGVTTKTVTVDGSLTTATETTWYMDVQSTSATYTTDAGVPLPPQSVTRQSFDYAFRDGTLQISRAKDFILSAKDLTFDPQPGDSVQFDATSWDDSADVWTVFGLTPIAPDNTPIIWQGILMRN